MLRKGRVPMGWIMLVLFLAILAAILLRVDDWNRDWTTNWAETDPQAEAADLRPFHSPLPPDALKRQVLEWVSQQPHWQTRDEPNEPSPSGPPTNSSHRSSLRLHLVRSTRIMRFKDDVEVTVDRDTRTGGSVLRVTSRSRIGSGDLGQNPRNIKELIAGIKTRR